jgi:hypothetical protein
MTTDPVVVDKRDYDRLMMIVRHYWRLTDDTEAERQGLMYLIQKHIEQRYREVPMSFNPRYAPDEWRVSSSMR